MKSVDTYEYMTALKELTDKGHEVSLVISGNSMAPFLISNRDSVLFSRPETPLKQGDIVFYQRDSGQYVMHRIYKIVKESGSDSLSFYMTGDNQTAIEGPLRADQIFARVNAACRKGKWLRPGDFVWDFFEKVWIRILPLRRLSIKAYSIFYKIKCLTVGH